MSSMKYKVLVIGYGSIGKRHVEVLKALGHDVSIVSGHLESNGLNIFSDVLSACNKCQFDYFIIAVSTEQHVVVLEQLKPFLSEKSIVFMEKPIFASTEQIIAFPENIYSAVGYVLRAHPLLRTVYNILADKKLLSCRVSCGQYLPGWRPGSDYRTCYSADKTRGGGVLRDISHELDYMYMLCGKWKRLTAIGGHFSNLEISSDDQYGILFETEKCPLCICHIDYLAHDVHRDLYVEYEGGSLHLDFIAGRLLHNGQETVVELERNDLFKIMHSEIIARDDKYFKGFDEAMYILTFLEAAEHAAGGNLWIENL